MKNENITIGILLLISLLISSCKKEQVTTYDLVITNGRVIDPETGLDAKRNIGINEDKIVEITEKSITGKDTIDATDLIVSPGFIDLHSHSVVHQPGQRMHAFDGVTTALELESGLLPVDTWYKEMDSLGNTINYGISASWTFARIQTMIEEMPPVQPSLVWYGQAYSYPRWTTDAGTEEQLNNVYNYIEEGLKEGALAIGVNAGYVPGMTQKELEDLAYLAKKYNVPISLHLRNWSIVEPNSSAQGIKEAIEASEKTGAKIIFCHINSSSLKDAEKVIKLIESARKRGVNVEAEAYPYGIGSFPVSSAILLQDSLKFKQRIGINFDKTYLIAQGRQIKNEQDIRNEQKSDPSQLVILEYLDEHNHNDKHILDLSATLPWCAVASDAVPWGLPNGQMYNGSEWPLPKEVVSNPRSAGTFAKFLRVYVREEKKLSMIEALKKMTVIPASILEESVESMKYKGRLQKGMDADIVIFNPNTITDKATVEYPAQTSEGVEFLIVNGIKTIENGKLKLEKNGGRPIRRVVKK